MNPAKKKNASTIAAQMANEPLEILKSARRQIVDDESSSENRYEAPKAYDNSLEIKRQELADKATSIRRMEAFQRELDDIKREELFKDIQRRIAQGENVPIENYQELSMEQKQVLKAQVEAYQSQRQNVLNQQNQNIAEPVAKKGRRLFNFGKKQEVKRQQTRVENVVPPSG